MEGKLSKLYGVGVGPGDYELMTLKSIRIIKEADIIAVPGRLKEESVAYNIALKAYPDLKNKETIAIYMPMTKDEERLDKAHKEAVDKLKHYLDKGFNIAFLTLGDVSIYSTYMYLHTKIMQEGYETEIVSGVTSFCAVAAKLGISLSENNRKLHIIPASYDIDTALKLDGTKILMKAASKLPNVKAKLKEYGLEAFMIENCGMQEEKIYRTVEEIPENSGYFSLIIVRDDINQN